MFLVSIDDTVCKEGSSIDVSTFRGFENPRSKLGRIRTRLSARPYISPSTSIPYGRRAERRDSPPSCLLFCAALTQITPFIEP
jgi:hypothetical protein